MKSAAELTFKLHGSGHVPTWATECRQHGLPGVLEVLQRSRSPKRPFKSEYVIYISLYKSFIVSYVYIYVYICVCMYNIYNKT